MINLSGIVPALVTPLNNKGQLDKYALRRLVRHVISGGVSGVFTMGSTGEFSAFSQDERAKIIGAVVDEVSGKVPVLAGVSDSSTELVLRNARNAEAMGADAVVSTLPYYFPVQSQEEVVQHFKALADVTSLPVIIYNIPQIAKGWIEVETTAQLAEDQIVMGIKDSSSDFNHFQKLIFRLQNNSRFHILQGNEFQLAASILMGASGGVVGIANLVPSLCVEIYKAALSGRVTEARELQRRLSTLGQLFYIGESVIGSLKAALSMLGLCSRITTSSMPLASVRSRRRIRQILEECGLVCGRAG